MKENLVPKGANFNVKQYTNYPREEVLYNLFYEYFMKKNLLFHLFHIVNFNFS